jgi:fucose 4-O-acetylase-like acetyltransferase
MARNNYERDVWLDALRGIAILLVVLGHALRGIESAGISTGPLIGFLDPRLYAVHVQLLFFVSGLVIVGSLRRHSVRRFANGRIPALLVPLVIWTYVFLGVKLLAGPFQNAPISWEALLVAPVPGQLHLWFLWALFLMHLVVAAVWALASERARTALFLGLFVAALAAQWLRLPGEVDHWIGHTLRFLPFLLLGVLLGLQGVRGARGQGASLAAAACAAGGFLFAPQLEAMMGWDAIPSLAVCLAVYFSASLVLARPRLAAMLGYLGVSAMAIYVLHTIFSAGLREALLAAGIDAPTPHVVLGIAAGVVLPILAREFCLRARVARPLALA